MDAYNLQCMYVCVCMHEHRRSMATNKIEVYVCMYVCVCKKYMYVFVRITIVIHTFIHTYIHTYMHTIGLSESAANGQNLVRQNIFMFVCFLSIIFNVCMTLCICLDSVSPSGRSGGGGDVLVSPSRQRAVVDLPAGGLGRGESHQSHRQRDWRRTWT